MKEIMIENMIDPPEENIMMKEEIDLITINIQDMMKEEKAQEENKDIKKIIMIEIIINQSHTEMIITRTIILEKENIQKIHILLITNMIIKKQINMMKINQKMKMKNIKINHKIQKRRLKKLKFKNYDQTLYHREFFLNTTEIKKME